MARIKREIKKSPFVAPDGYLSRNDAMKFLGVSNATLYHWELRGILHPMRIGIYTVYPKEELEKYVKQNKK